MYTYNVVYQGVRRESPEIGKQITCLLNLYKIYKFIQYILFFSGFRRTTSTENMKTNYLSVGGS